MFKKNLKEKNTIYSRDTPRLKVKAGSIVISPQSQTGNANL